MWCSVESLVHGTPYRQIAPNVQDHKTDIAKKVTTSQPVSYNDQCCAASAAANQPAARLSDSTFVRALKTPDIQAARLQTSSLALRAREEWTEVLGEMLVAIALDRPLAHRRLQATRKADRSCLKIIQDKQLHPVIEGMVRPMCETK